MNSRKTPAHQNSSSLCSSLTRFPSSDISFLKTHKESICSSSFSEETYIRPPLWEDITSSIQNIDPENAIMLAEAAATHVKLEANDSEKYIESIRTSSQLSTLEVKPESKYGTSQLYASIPTHLQNHATHSVQTSNSMSLDR